MRNVKCQSCKKRESKLKMFIEDMGLYPICRKCLEDKGEQTLYRQFVEEYQEFLRSPEKAHTQRMEELIEEGGDS